MGDINSLQESSQTAFIFERSGFFVFIHLLVIVNYQDELESSAGEAPGLLQRLLDELIRRGYQSGISSPGCRNPYTGTFAGAAVPAE